MLLEYKEYTTYVYLTESINDTELLEHLEKIKNCTSLTELNQLELELNNFNINEGVLSNIKDFIVDKAKKLKNWFTKNFLITQDDFQQKNKSTKPLEENILLNLILPFTNKNIQYSIFNGDDSSNYNRNFSTIFDTYSVDSKFLDPIKKIDLLNIFKLWNPNSKSVEYVVHIYAKPRPSDEIDQKLLKYEEIKSILPSVRILIKNPKEDLEVRLKEYYKKLLSLNKEYKERIKDDINFNKNYVDIAAKTILMDIKNNKNNSKFI